MGILKNLRHEKNVPTQNQFVEGREKVAPRESKQNIKCTQYNLLYLQNQGKVFLSLFK